MEELLNIKDVKRILGVSPGVVIGFVQRGELPAYRFAGGRVDRAAVTPETQGLRFDPKDVRALMKKMLVS